MEVKSGYKQTKVGVIPEEWELTRLGEIGSVCAGGTPSRGNPRYWNGDIPWVTTSEVDFCTITQAEQFITAAGLKNSAARILPPGTLLMALYGQGNTRGKVAILGIEAATNQACAAISLNQRASSDFIFHSLVGRYDAIRNLSNTGNQENLNGQIVRSIIIPLPPKPEQRVIARALSDADALLDGLDRLIANKRDLKQAAMQQLLTGQTRHPGFHGEWEVKRLGDVADTLKGRGLSKGQVARSGTRPCILYGELFTTYKRVISTVVSRTDSSDGCASVAGDVLMPGSTTTSGIDLATASALLEDGVALGGDINVIRRRGDDYDPAFIANYLTSVMRKQIAELTQGITIHHLYGRELKTLALKLPSRDEQTAIADVVSDMDAELAALEERREKTRALKQAMMQELLTGKTRLV